jgi:hypothetical protein
MQFMQYRGVKQGQPPQKAIFALEKNIGLIKTMVLGTVSIERPFASKGQILQPPKRR